MTDLLLEHGSYLIITLVLILTGSGLPIPEEVPIIAAGILSAHGTLDPWLAFACCLFGALVGDTIMYWIGFHFGRGVLRDHPYWARWVTPERERQIESMFRRHGFKLLFVARFLVGLRSPVYLTTGIMRVSFRRFIFIDLFCATAVVGTFFSITYFFGREITSWIRQAEGWLTVAVVIGLACLGVYLWKRRRRNMPQSDSADVAEEADADVEEQYSIDEVHEVV
ncbi:MAG: DedA family protein [Pirellulaceae bacterium]|nr:DedA family protein [Pirellulaceae bacterium]